MIMVKSCGDSCLSSAFASIFHMSINDIPIFHGGYNNSFMVQRRQFRKYCLSLGLDDNWGLAGYKWEICDNGFIITEIRDHEVFCGYPFLRDRYIIGCTETHAVVVKNNLVVWDPSGLCTKICQVITYCHFLPINESGRKLAIIANPKHKY
jgi:hypothetical protein